MTIPSLSESIIRHHTTSQSFDRGEDYYRAQAVTAIAQRGKTIQADVEGNEASNYRVSIGFDTGGITSAYCTCPYEYEGWCKHIAATLLVCVRQPNSIEDRPTLVQLLDRLDHQKIQHLIQALVAEQPDLIDAIDRHVSLISLPTPQKQTAKAAKTPRRTTIDATPFRRQVKQILREGLRYLEEGYDEGDPVADDLQEVIGKADAFTEQGDGNNAIAILEVITATCAEEWDDLSDYGVDSDSICESLNEAWTEAILSAELPDEQKAELRMRLEEWQDQLGGSFEMSLAALAQGWDYPALQRVFEGSITEQGAWEGESPNFADDLAVIRLRILDRQNRQEEYLYLAEAESQTLLYLTKLANLGRIDEAITAAKTDMTTPEEAFALAQALREQQYVSEALEIARVGLTLTGSEYRIYELATWTSDLAEGLGDSTTALAARITAFKTKPSFKDYRKIEDLAGKTWSKVRADLLKTLRQANEWQAREAKVDIFLHEGLIDDAIAAVKTDTYHRSEYVHRVMEAAIAHNPEWVIENARLRAEPIMDAGKAERYSEAVRWLKKVRAAYLQLGQKSKWSAYRTQLTTTHGRKRNLMALFQQGDMS
jgi:uncharacterized Zn finger protein